MNQLFGLQHRRRTDPVINKIERSTKKGIPFLSLINSQGEIFTPYPLPN